VVKVLHIAGLPRGGSTILASVLGEIEGFVCAGELLYLGKTLASHEPCECGRDLWECPVWRPIFDTVFASHEEGVSRLREASRTRARDLPLLLWHEQRGDARLARYRSMLDELCRAIGTVTGARVIVEASKRPGYGRVLAGMPNVPTYVVHLVRDPRATVYSWVQSQWNAIPATVAAAWTTWQWAIPYLWRDQRDRYLALRYEDFVREPRRTILEILAHVGEPADELPFVDEHTVRLESHHMPNGNENRFRTGPVALRVNDEWRAGLGRGNTLLTTAAALPLLHRWGYPVRT
jgi:Sulfotransferase family